MSIKVVKQSTRIEIWVSSDVDAGKLERCIKRCCQYGMPIVVYRSGKGILVELTGTLLANNAAHNITDNID